MERTSSLRCSSFLGLPFGIRITELGLTKKKELH